ncbi:hypothetical protein VST7929_00660 [Vibrio stylophorae]|uniref:Uncharacterized protein n=1 Tax=Vibrio stylophorae TaxID=659351 RepID=A0ABN8DSK5_9VIBR|nr:hypothetical protein [Vibrio stylophorae]CAH0532813.1 hypothetical protein VST7929_00660 [Vibrio stylophorae]
MPQLEQYQPKLTRFSWGMLSLLVLVLLCSRTLAERAVTFETQINPHQLVSEALLPAALPDSHTPRLYLGKTPSKSNTLPAIFPPQRLWLLALFSFALLVALLLKQQIPSHYLRFPHHRLGGWQEANLRYRFAQAHDSK